MLPIPEDAFDWNSCRNVEHTPHRERKPQSETTVCNQHDRSWGKLMKFQTELSEIQMVDSARPRLKLHNTVVAEMW